MTPTNPHIPGQASSMTRRGALTAGAVASGGMLLTRIARGQLTSHVTRTSPEHQPLAPAEPIRDYTPVVVPNGWTLPHKIIDGVKVFHLVAEEVDHEFAPGLKVKCWSYNGGVHGPVIEAVEGDRVRILVTNKLPEATTAHWHGVLVPAGMDGVSGLTQAPIQPGETFMYEFTLVQHGTLMYHSHHDEMTQMGLGLTGMFIIHPRNPATLRPDRDFVLLLHEWKIPVGASRPDPNEMTDFNMLTINGKAFPGTQPLIVKHGDRVRIRLGNLGAMDHHPIHLHGYSFKVTQTDGGMIPESAQWPETTVLVPVGNTRTIEFTADKPGDWAMHCHMTHHTMNQMGHGLPNMIGVDARGLDGRIRSLLPSYMTMGQTGMGDMMEMESPPNSIAMQATPGPHGTIDMGGMFTILKVREGLANYDEDPGWYVAPEGTRAMLATEETLRAAGIDAQARSAPRAPESARRSWKHAVPASDSSAQPSPAHEEHRAHAGHS